jgi:hypothetical protein
MSRPTQWIKSRSRLALVVGVVGASVLALSTTASLGGFSASITNTGDKVATGDLIMQEQVGPTGGTVVTTCLSTAAGSTITTNSNLNCTANKFGALTNAIPGASNATNVVLTNLGSVAANTFTATANGCTAVGTVPPGATATNVGSDTAGFCGVVDLTIEDDTTAGSPKCILPAATGACPALANSTTLSTLANSTLTLPTPVAAGGSKTFKFTVGIDAGATNADQAMAATMPITFNFGS